MLNSRNFTTGIRLVANATLTGSIVGDLQSYAGDGQLYYNDGSGNNAVLTGTSSNVITNKTISGSANTITNISLTSSVIGVLPVLNGGTGQTTLSGAFNALSPMTTAGDLIIGGVSGSGTRLAATTNGFVLTLVSGSPAWVAPTNGVSSVNSLTGALNITAGSGITVTPSGSNIQITATGASYTFADSIVNTGGTVTLVGDTASPGASQYYGTNGSSTLGYYAIPSPISGLTTDGVVYAASSTTVASTTVGTSGQVLTSNGVGFAPTFQVASGGNPFDFFASSQVTTDSTAIASSTFTTFSNDPGFTFTPNFSGTYKVYSSAPLEAITSGGAYARIHNSVGSATLLQEQSATIFNPVGGNIITSVTPQSIFTLTASTSYTFVLQGKVDSTNTTELKGILTPFYVFAERIG